MPEIALAFASYTTPWDTTRSDADELRRHSADHLVRAVSQSKQRQNWAAKLGNDLGPVAIELRHRPIASRDAPIGGRDPSGAPMDCGVKIPNLPTSQPEPSTPKTHDRRCREAPCERSSMAHYLRGLPQHRHWRKPLSRRVELQVLAVTPHERCASVGRNTPEVRQTGIGRDLADQVCLQQIGTSAIGLFRENSPPRFRTE